MIPTIIDTEVLLVGIHEERLNEIEQVIKSYCTSLQVVNPFHRESLRTKSEEESTLAVLTDASAETYGALNNPDLGLNSNALVIGCMPRSEFLTSREMVSRHVDDLLFDPLDFEYRIQFIKQRIGIREARKQEYQAVFDNIVDGIITIDERGTIIAFNNAAEEIFGYTAMHIIGRSVSTLMPDSYAAEHSDYIRTYMRTGHARIVGVGREVVGVRKNGESFPMELAVSELRTDGRTLFTGVVRDITERRLLEQEILRISDRERRRIGQDLHDGLGQMLTGIGLIAQNITKRLEDDNSSLSSEMAEVTELIKEADRSARTLSRGLVPVELDELGLVGALETLVGNVAKLLGISCTLDSEGPVLLRDTASTSNVYRITQEAISNAVKHGKASNVRISLTRDGRRHRLEIRDDGIGFPEVLPADRGMGVRIMKYRARVIGGSLEIHRAESGGTIVSCVFFS
jgi:two-component system, LuxR family, sensor kinase FixL